MTVRAKQGEAVKLNIARPGRMQGSDVVILDASDAELPVRVAEVEGTDFAPEGLSQLPDLLELLVAQSAVPLAVERPADQEAAFTRARLVSVLSGLVQLGGNEMQLAAGDSCASAASVMS